MFSVGSLVANDGEGALAYPVNPAASIARYFSYPVTIAAMHPVVSVG